MLLVNDRADIARLAGADGVHVGQDDLDPAAARRVVGDDAIVGRSTHTLAQIASAAREPVDYIAVGPVFATASKTTGYEAVGLELVRQAVRYGKPIVAIGGISEASAAEVIGAGAASVAVIGELLRTGNPRERVRALLEAVVPARKARRPDFDDLGR
ncbi:MAG: thiamine phosphate synthase [Acidobacteria bacterium]|nr:thiamine phosphate synthase [Acidobacteriota bacterium]